MNIKIQDLKADQPPIMIVGVDRSGTTLLSLMLDSHSRIAIPYESKFFIRYYMQRDKLGDLTIESGRQTLVLKILNERMVDRWEKKITINDVNLDNCVSLEKTISELFEAYARAFNKDIWGDKTPSYITHLDVLNKMFPDCRFVHIVRDGRDVASSLINQWWGPNDFTSAVYYWNEKVTCAKKMLKMLPDNRYIEVRFEDLVTEPEDILRNITDFLGVEFEQNMLSGYLDTAASKIGDNIVKKVHPHLGESPSKTQALKWISSLPKVDQAIAFDIAGATLTELGYPRGATKSRWKLLRELYHRTNGAYAWRFAKEVGPPEK